MDKYNSFKLKVNIVCICAISTICVFPSCGDNSCDKDGINEHNNIKKYESIVKKELGTDYEIIKRNLILIDRNKKVYNSDYKEEKNKTYSDLYPFYLIKNKFDNKIDIACACVNVRDRSKPSMVVIIKHAENSPKYKVSQVIQTTGVDLFVYLFYSKDGRQLYLSITYETDTSNIDDYIYNPELHKYIKIPDDPNGP